MPPRKRKQVTQNQEAFGSDEEEFVEMDVDLDEADRRMEGQKGTGRKSTGAILDPEELEKKAGDLCRLALFTEYKRALLKREDINKKVLGGNSKAFPAVLDKANKRLRSSFGYEIVELVSRSQRERIEKPNQQQSEDEGGKKKSPQPSKTYILRSALEPELIELACAPDQDILRQEEEDSVEEDARFYGSIIAWQTSDQVGAYGILCVILSLILISGKGIADPALRSRLKKLRLQSNSTIDVGPPNAPKKITLEQYLTILTRQGYLDKIKHGVIKGTNKRGRGRADQDQGEGAADYEWKWGERSQAEISEEGIRDFMVSFLLDRTRAEGEEQETEAERAARLEKLRKQLLRDIARSASTTLTRIVDEDDVAET